MTRHETDKSADRSISASEGEADLHGGARVRWWAVTARGRRAENEDTWAASPPLFLVADGMGGYAAGAEASRIAVETVVAEAQPGATPDAAGLGARIRLAHERVVERSLSLGRTMGSTLTGTALTALPGEDGFWSWLVFNVGDSRAYACSAGTVRQVSVDHSVVQELMAAGHLEAAGAASHPQRHVVTRALGTQSPHEPDFWAWPAAAGDRLLLCSDGLLLVGEEQAVVADVLVAVHPEEVLLRLLQPVATTARDNVTVVVVELLGRVAAMDDEATAPRAAVDA